MSIVRNELETLELETLESETTSEENSEDVRLDPTGRPDPYGDFDSDDWAYGRDPYEDE